ncbi:type IX secretion system protein PorG [Pedobacter metabolipauper]|uniref:Outer membrane protein beta-barrel domain-containing protein n=1 Tax=Pedobacter metabolipauper TaxID=425513 RepID=A0A4R6SS50_9SPHI|nr:DUF6089 family protein [Pedobacter metabolipauper]TDQ07381.1 Outer membrane protein beta-barrel domain-containing protein [Pedobacter metabolipauper]
MRYKQLFYFFTLFLPAMAVQGQTVEIGLTGGGAGYLGDLNQNNPLKISGMSAGGYVKLNLDAYWSVGLHYNYGSIKADDQESSNEHFRNRALNFKTSLNEVSMQVDFNFLEYFTIDRPKKFTPYLFAGVGAVFFNPVGTYRDPGTSRNTDYKLRFYQTEGQSQLYKNYALAIPYGAGIKLRLSDNMQFLSQIGYRTANTDYLDDVSGRYPDPVNVNWPNDGNLVTRIKLSNPSNQSLSSLQGTQRGDFRKRDTYMFVGIGISYTFVSQKCYTF